MPPTPSASAGCKDAECKAAGCKAAGLQAAGLHAAGLKAARVALQAAGLQAAGLQAARVALQAAGWGSLRKGAETLYCCIWGFKIRYASRAPGFATNETYDTFEKATPKKGPSAVNSTRNAATPPPHPPTPTPHPGEEGGGCPPPDPLDSV